MRRIVFASFPWLLIPTQGNPAKGTILADFLNWMLEQGQGMATQLTYAPLPQEVKEKVRSTVSAHLRTQPVTPAGAGH